MDIDIQFLDENPEQKAEKPDSEPIVITDSATDRYHTFGLISWWKQEIVRSATVMVIGAGALGNEVLKNLALMGVGQIFIVDFDTIEDANLSRSVLFRATDNGRKKAEVAAAAVQEINPDVAVQWLHGDVNHDIGLGVFRRMDVIIGCLDNREARLSINKACWHLDKPWIDGAIQELLGIARVFKPNHGACYECTLKDEDYKIMAMRQSCQLLAHKNVIEGRVPTTPTISSIIASIQTQEALKILHNMPVDTGKALVFNGLINDVFNMEYAIKEDCPSHWKYETIIPLPEAGSAHTTLRELSAIARQTMGMDTAALAIPPFATRAFCVKCNYQNELLRPYHSLTFEDAKCPSCSELMNIEFTERVRGNETFLDITLFQAGIPPLDIIPAVTDNWEYQYFELAGDQNSYFHFEKQ